MNLRSAILRLLLVLPPATGSSTYAVSLTGISVSGLPIMGTTITVAK